MRKAVLTMFALTIALTLATSGISFACDGSSAGTSAKSACTGVQATEAKLANAKDHCSTTAKLACGGDKATTETSTANVEGETVILSVSNMTCNGCVKAVTSALVKTDGVSNAVVSLDDGTAKVTYDKEKVKTDDLINAVIKAGFAAKVFDATVTTDGQVKGDCSATTKTTDKSCAYSKGSCTGKKDKDSSI